MMLRETEFRKIHDAFQPKILRYMARLVGESEAKDLTQEVFIKISRAMKTFRSESSLSTWIYRIATNTALDRLRSPEYKRMASEAGHEIEDMDLWTGNKTAPVDQQLIRREMNECIRGLVDKLPEDYRAVLILGEFEGLKNSEIAGILGITVSAAKVRLHRARAKMKKELEAHCSFYRDERNELACDKKDAFIKFR
jgi:RNA polymerase sigma-70 factor (ECF subfamily)